MIPETFQLWLRAENSVINYSICLWNTLVLQKQGKFLCNEPAGETSPLPNSHHCHFQKLDSTPARCQPREWMIQKDKICSLQLFSHRMLVVLKVRRKLNGWRSPLRPGSTKTKTWNLMRCESLISSYTNFQMFNTRWKSFWAISLRQNFNCR